MEVLAILTRPGLYKNFSGPLHNDILVLESRLYLPYMPKAVTAIDSNSVAAAGQQDLQRIWNISKFYSYYIS